MRKIWQKYNTSLVFVLPHLSDISDGVSLRGKKGRKYPFIRLCFVYGLQNTYLLNDNGVFDGNLYLEFSNEVYSHKNVSDLQYSNLHELFIDNRRFTRKINNRNRVIYGFKIENRYHRDIVKIMQGRYSEVSDNYKTSISYSEKQSSENIIILKKWKKDDDRFIMINDLAYSICNKKTNVKNWIKDFYEIPITEDMELFERFHADRERIAA